ncbi:MAG TPA: T9SS type A sorting domain-containing protein [Bacteroidia bacterium]|nr:T9SS type A sorting domain-containing protein [Bacteroidia bacterium]
MKRCFQLSIIAMCCLLQQIVLSQDIINPYLSYSTNQYPSIFYGGNVPLNYNFEHPMVFGDISSYKSPNNLYYLGEYELCVRKHFWWDLLGFENVPFPTNVSVSYQYEMVSFPFTMNCAFTNSTNQNSSDPPGCNFESTQDRFLYMPDPSSTQHVNTLTEDYWVYSVNGLTWSNKLYNKTNIQKIDASGYSSGVLAGAGSPYIANTLVSAAFEATNGIGNSNGNEDRKAIPHTVIKHTLNLHNGVNASPSNIVLSYFFYYDNTRGRMRFYPFVPINSQGGSQNSHDVIFVPEIITNLHQDNAGNYDKPHEYDDNYNSDLILPGGVLNYFPTGELPLYPLCGNSPCSLPLPGNTFATGPFVDFIYPSPFTLYSAPLRSSGSQYLAGYELNQSSQIAPLPGIRHSYFIDQNTDLNIINPTEKEIYNPSETTITASNFVFPQDYTFKTIRGVYPSEAEALASRIIENGCDANTDLREVPVKTDLTTENTTDAVNFPLSALPATQHLYASRYYLENNSKLTVQQCVSLFDCTFDVKQGATLLFDDYPAHYGKEDYSYDRANTRFKIQTLGGAVLRNYNDVQYLQNGDITQTLPLHYKAIREIYAGSNVDPDQDIPKQDYVAQGGSNITMQAGEVIYLKEGFHAMSGSNVHIMPTSPGGSAGPCNLPIAARMAAATQQHQQKKYETLPALNIYPNPTANVVKLHNRFMPLKAERLVIVDVYGRTVYEQVNFNSILHTPDFSHEPDGMYMAKVMQQGKTETLKFMVQH